MVRKT